jgi:hypothetical protein
MSSKKVTEFHEMIDNKQLLEYINAQKFTKPTSIQAKATLYDLLDLNLAYSPPYGSARDVINVVASVAINGIERKIKYVKGMNVPEKAFIIDVRPETVFSMGSMNGAINIDKEELRTTDRLPKDKKKRRVITGAL